MSISNGSLALTGKGHGTDRAVLLRLSAGESPETVDPAKAAGPGRHTSLRSFFNRDMVLPGHPNTMRFNCEPGWTQRVVYYSTRRRLFILREGEKPGGHRCRGLRSHTHSAVRAPRCWLTNIPVWQLMLENEKAWHSGTKKIRAYTCTRIWKAMRGLPPAAASSPKGIPAGRPERSQARAAAGA